jgi:hypothetical protein
MNKAKFVSKLNNDIIDLAYNFISKKSKDYKVKTNHYYLIYTEDNNNDWSQLDSNTYCEDCIDKVFKETENKIKAGEFEDIENI